MRRLHTPFADEVDGKFPAARFHHSLNGEPTSQACKTHVDDIDTSLLPISPSRIRVQNDRFTLHPWLGLHVHRLALCSSISSHSLSAACSSYVGADALFCNCRAAIQLKAAKENYFVTHLVSIRFCWVSFILDGLPDVALPPMQTYGGS